MAKEETGLERLFRERAERIKKIIREGNQELIADWKKKFPDEYAEAKSQVIKENIAVILKSDDEK